jgi:hypothetical protein
MLKDSVRFVFITICFAGILISGCTDINHGVTKPTSQIMVFTTPETPALTQLEETTIPSQAPVLVTTIPPTTAPVTDITIAPTTLSGADGCPACSGSSPIPKPITLKGDGDGLVFFEAAAPGTVNFTVSTSKDKSCTDDQIGFKLAGTSICNSMERSFSGRFTNIDLPNSGKYSITIRGCQSWKIVIKNG